MEDGVLIGWRSGCCGRRGADGRAPCARGRAGVWIAQRCARHPWRGGGRGCDDGGRRSSGRPLTLSTPSMSPGSRAMEQKRVAAVETGGAGSRRGWRSIREVVLRSLRRRHPSAFHAPSPVVPSRRWRRCGGTSVRRWRRKVVWTGDRDEAARRVQKLAEGRRVLPPSHRRCQIGRPRNF